MKVRIYKPAKTAMQSGRAGSEKWVLEYQVESARKPEPVMGWVSSEDTLNQVRIKFDNKASAVAFAEGEGWQYTIDEPHQRKIRPRSYLDNFRYVPPEDTGLAK